MRKLLVENENAKIEFDEKIVYAVWKQTNVCIERAKESVHTRVTATEGKVYPLLADTRAIKNISKEAREYLGSKSGSEGVSQAAILVKSSVGSVIANFFLQINKPLVPTKLFTSEEAAIKWLTKVD